MKKCWVARGGRQRFEGLENLFGVCVCVFSRTFSRQNGKRSLCFHYLAFAARVHCTVSTVFIFMALGKFTSHSGTSEMHSHKRSFFLAFRLRKLFEQLMEIDLSHFQFQLTVSKEPDNRARHTQDMRRKCILSKRSVCKSVSISKTF